MSGVKLSPGEAKTLQALRAGPMDATQIGERFDKNYCPRLIANDLVLLESGFYKITAKGRDACPNRRSNLPPAPVMAAPRKLMDMPIKQALPKRNEEKMTIPAIQPMALQILQFIEANPNCVSAEITAATGEKTIDGYIRSYIDAGKITATRIDPNKRNGIRYKIADSLTVKDFYRGPGKETLTEKPALKHEQVPKFIDDDSVPTYVKEMLEHTVLPDFTAKEEPKPSEEPKSSKVRFAMTSDNTLIIQGLGYSDIELDAAATYALVEFIEGASMMLPTHGHFVGGAAL